MENLGKLIEKFRTLFDGYVLARFEKLLPKDIITRLYRVIVISDLNIQTREISVKKGKLRYTLLIVKDKNLKTKFNLGRI